MQKHVWGALAVLFVLVSCAPDKTLESLVPSNSVAVAYLENPRGFFQDALTLAQSMAQPLPALPAEFPVDALDFDRSWAFAALPPKGAENSGALAVQFYIPLKDATRNFNRVSDFLLKQGGLSAALVGNFAVVSSAGAPAAQVHPEGKYFELERAQLSEGHGLSVYFDMKNVMDSVVFPEALKDQMKFLPLLQSELDGIRLGLFPTTLERQVPGVRFSLQTDLKKTSKTWALVSAWNRTSRLEDWANWLDDDAPVSLGVNLPPAGVGDDAFWASLGDSPLRQHLRNLRELIGPRVAINLTGGLEPSATQPLFSGVMESPDPHALRQALKSLVASGALQKSFLQFAMDADTPLVYQDQPGGPLGLRTKLSLGPFVVNFAWGSDKVYFASGNDTQGLDALIVGGRVTNSWKGPVPAGASLLESFNLGAWAKLFPDQGNPVGAVLPPAGVGGSVQASVKIEEGNPRFQLWWGADGLKAWWAKAAKTLPGLLRETLKGAVDSPPPAPLKTHP